MTVRAGREFLSIPGPTTVPDAVLQAMQRPAIDIYAGPMVELTHSLLADLAKLFRTGGRCYIYIANGHGAWEAALVNVLAPGDRVLTFDPWFTSWHIGRDAVMIPSGGPAELAAVARRYDARWLLAWSMFTRPRTSRTVMQLGPRADGIAVTKTYEDRVCRVYRLAW